MFMPSRNILSMLLVQKSFLMGQMLFVQLCQTARMTGIGSVSACAVMRLLAMMGCVCSAWQSQLYQHCRGAYYSAGKATDAEE
jgi:hypothetical protein